MISGRVASRWINEAYTQLSGTGEDARNVILRSDTSSHALTERLPSAS